MEKRSSQNVKTRQTHMGHGACRKAGLPQKSPHSLCALLHVEPFVNYALECFLFFILLQYFLSLSHSFAAIMKHKMTTVDPLLTPQLNFTSIMNKKYVSYSRYWEFGFLILLLFKIYSYRLYPVCFVHVGRPTEAYIYIFRGLKSVG